MLAVQVIGSMCLGVPTIVAPVLAPLFGLAPDRVGVFMAAVFLAAMVSGVRCGSWVISLGAVQVSQLALLTLGLSLLGASAGQSAWLLPIALLLGAGYGMINPSSAILLSRNSPSGQRGLYFSIKQAGVPLGVALAGAMLPWAMGALGWRGMLLALGGVSLAGAVMLVPLRARLQSPDQPMSGRSNARWPSEVLAVVRDPHLRRLSAAAFVLEFVQLAVLTFLVSYLHLELGFSLAVAAGVLAASQIVSVVARIGWGHVGDRWATPGAVLAGLGLGAGFALIALGGLGLLPRPPHAGDAAMPELFVASAFGAAALCALTAMGWNGVFFAELARQVVPERLPTVAGATQTVSFVGCMAGPVVFGEILRQGGSFSTSFLILAPLPIVAGIHLLRRADGR